MINKILKKREIGLSYVLSIIGLLLFAQMIITMLGLSFGLAGEYWNVAHKYNTQYSFFITWCIASGIAAIPFILWMLGFAKFNQYYENKKTESWSVVSKKNVDE